MVASFLLILFGVPLIIFLTRMAVKRGKEISKRADQVKEEMARDPQSPYTALAEMLQAREQNNRK
jgi:hypothetical protein